MVKDGGSSSRKSRFESLWGHQSHPVYRFLDIKKPDGEGSMIEPGSTLRQPGSPVILTKRRMIMNIQDFAADIQSANKAQLMSISRLVITELGSRAIAEEREELISQFDSLTEDSAANATAKEDSDAEYNDDLPDGYSIGDIVTWDSKKYQQVLRGSVIGAINGKLRVRTDEGKKFRLPVKMVTRVS